MHMVRRGDTMEDPKGGARVRFLETAQGTNGELLRLECFLEPRGVPPGGGIPHVHPQQTERIEVVSGAGSICAGGGLACARRLACLCWQVNRLQGTLPVN